MHSLRYPAKKNFIESQIDSTEHAAEWQKISDWYRNKASSYWALIKERSMVKKLRASLENYNDNLSLKLNVLLLVGDLNYTICAYNDCKECYRRVLEILDDPQREKLTFYSKNITTGKAKPVNVSAVRFHINKSLAYVLKRQKDYPGCIKAASAALADNPNSLRLMVLKTDILQNMGNWSECIACGKSLREFCKINNKQISSKDDVIVRASMAFSYDSLGAKKLAMEEIDYIVKNNPGGLKYKIISGMLRLYKFLPAGEGPEKKDSEQEL